MRIQHNAHIDGTPFIYTVTDFIHFLVLSFYQCEEEALLPHLLPVWNLFISTSPPSYQPPILHLNPEVWITGDEKA